MAEHRKYSRVTFDAIIKLHHKEHLLKAHLLDISLKGALVKVDDGIKIPLHERVLMFMELGGSALVLQIECELVHQQAQQLGLKFIYIDVESITHLRRLMELNVGDSGQIDRELEFFSSQW
ncbi:PilZ domain-containing protein [Deltaproteobacteria bacterium TL4]